jgi:hypothetical protein
VAKVIEGSERSLLEAIVLFIDRTCLEEDGYVRSGALSDFEEAMDVLVGYGLLEWLDDVFQHARWTSAGEEFREAAYRNHPREDFEVEFSELPWATDLPLVETAAAGTISADVSLELGNREQFLLIAMLRLAEGSRRGPRAAIWALVERGFIEKSEEEFVEEFDCNRCFVTWSDKAKKFWDGGRVTRQSHRAWSLRRAP